MSSGEPESIQLLQGAGSNHSEAGQSFLNEETMRSRNIADWLELMVAEELR